MESLPNARAKESPDHSASTPYDVPLVALFALCLAMSGFTFRSPDTLAAFWPANGVLLGLLLVRPTLARPACFAAILVAFITADIFVAHTSALRSIILNFINLVGIAVGYLTYRRIFGLSIDLGQPLPIIRLYVVAAVAALAEAVLGGVFAPIVSDQSMVTGAVDWFSAEFLSYVTLLPVILGVPGFVRQKHHKWRRQINLRRVVLACLPGVLLVVSLLVALLIKGGGAVAFPVIALSYCALIYSVFVTSLVVVFFTVWTTLVSIHGLLPIVDKPTDLLDIVSLRLAIASIALTPLIIASAVAARDQALARWRSLADSDSLTGTLNLRGFYRRARTRLRRRNLRRQPVAVLMLDLDHFKKINDTHGHGAGDQTLIMVVDLLRQRLRGTDICGRLGGDELVVLLAEGTLSKAQAVAERIRAAIEQCRVRVEGCEPIRLTVSIGLYFADPAPDDLAFMLRAADKALYLAKRNGRNQVHTQAPPV